MIAAQAMAAHHASMECSRRVVIWLLREPLKGMAGKVIPKTIELFGVGKVEFIDKQTKEKIRNDISEKIMVRIAPGPPGHITPEILQEILLEIVDAIPSRDPV